MKEKGIMNFTTIVFILAVSAILTFVSTPFVKMLAQKIGAVDIPKDGRRMHKKPIPRLGGLAMFYGFIVGILVFVTLEPRLLGMLAGTLLIVIVGIIDDRKALNAKPKFLIQILSACIAVFAGVKISFVTLPIIGGLVIPSPYAEILSVFWIVGITNAVNLIDGLDGLAAGVSLIASVSMLFISLIMAHVESALISAALVGCCIGFLPFNSNPAKIFMGDTGATFLGFVLGCVSIQGAFKSYALVSFVLPFMVLGLPIFDTAFAILRRIRHHKPIMEADRGHLHHRLIDIGFNQKQSVIILYSATSLLGLSAVVMADRGLLKGMVLIASLVPVALAAFYYLIKKESEIKSEEENEK